MTSIKTLTAAAAGALALASAASMAQAQTQPYYPTQTQPQTQSSGEQVLGAILGALFGTGQQTLDDQWRRGTRPLYNGQTQFQTRLDAGVRDRTLTYDQSTRLRSDYADLVALETRYYSDRQFSTSERADLSERYRQLSQRLDGGWGDGGYDNGYGGYATIAEGRTAFDARVDAALRAREISRTESTRLKADYATLIRLETSYQRGGLDSRERADLQSQLRALNERVGDNYDNGGGNYGDYRSQIARIGAAIAAGERSGQINRNESERLRTELEDLTRLEAAYSPSGYNADESSYLTRRFGELDTRVRNRSTR
ncbi:MAG: hypothetical protein V4707_13455 [Pseudomonadota bacterium]